MAEIGPNSLPPPKRRSGWRRFLAQFKNLLIYILLAAAVVTAAIGEWEDALVILGVVVINAVVGYIQEGKAERPRRDPEPPVGQGHRRARWPAARAGGEDLVPGDVVFLQPGDRVPADIRLIDAAGLRVTRPSSPASRCPSTRTRRRRPKRRSRRSALHGLLRHPGHVWPGLGSW